MKRRMIMKIMKMAMIIKVEMIVARVQKNKEMDRVVMTHLPMLQIFLTYPILRVLHGKISLKRCFFPLLTFKGEGSSPAFSGSGHSNMEIII